MKALQGLRVVLVATASFLVPLTTVYGGQTAEKEFEDFNPSNFARSTQIDNAWFPLKPGTRYVYEGTTVEDDGTAVPHRVVFTVTDLTKVIDGVRTVVAWDQDYSGGKLVETEIVFFAQDNNGNVWHLGQYPEEYEDGKFIEAPTWIHGLEGAKAGIAMQAKPRPGTPSYSQGWGPAVNWTDRGVVEQVGQKICVPLRCYEDVLVIAETSKEEPNATQLKYYAQGVGNIRVGWRGKGEKTKEILELIRVEQLGPEALAEVRAKVLGLENHAYEVSKDVYALSNPIEHPLIKSTTPKKYQPKTTAQATAKGPKISEAEAVKIAVKAVPGEVTDVAIEKKLGANRYVVEVVSKEDGAETDVIIDMETGKVLATEK